MRDERFNFNSNIKRVTGGPGGEAYLVIGDDKTAVIDCGMSYCANRLVENIKRELPSGKPLDYIMLTHTHYDHMGGLPYLKQAWPDAITVGSKYAKYIFERPSALNKIRELSGEVDESFLKSCTNGEPSEEFQMTCDYNDKDIKIDQVVKENDCIDLGRHSLKVIESPGHTNCSISFLMEEDSIFFPAETMGCLTPSGDILMAILKGYHDTIDSIQKAKQLDTKQIISPHYGLVAESIKPHYFDLAIETAETYKDFILKMYDSGLSIEEILEAYIKRLWRDYSYNQQPFEAFRLNSYYTISTILKEFRDISL